MKKILTIIVPSYNISKYVDSIMNHYIYEPLFAKVNLLFVDDGATDNTVELLKPYEEKYPQYITIAKKQNGGHGSVINYGIKLVETKYFKVIDGDDWISPEELDKLCDHLINCDDDIIVSNFFYEFCDRVSLSLGYDGSKQFPYKIHLHNVTFSTKLWIEHQISVREKVFYEDAEYTFYPLEYTNKISYFNVNVYHYRCDNPTQSVNPLQQLKHKNDYVLVAKDLCEFYERINNNDTISSATKQYLATNIARIVFGAYEICSSKGLSFAESKKMWQELDEVFKKYKKIFKVINKKYKKYKRLKIFNYYGLKLYLKR